MTDFFDAGRPHNGHTYDEYRAHWMEQKDRAVDGTTDKEKRKLIHYLNYNWERQANVHDAYEPSAELRSALTAIDEEQVWMVLTEPWCGDSAFLLPVIAEAAAESDAVTLRILLRDENLDIMDQYLTDGSRSIPKLVVFSEDGTERFSWGPRPESVARRYAELREQDLPKETLIQKVIETYEDGAWTEADDELIRELEQVGAAA